MTTMSYDRIVYTVVSAPGGCDGMDHKARGGKVLLATYNREEALKKIGRDSRYILEKQVVDIKEAKKEALAKLTKLDTLVLLPDEDMK